MSNQLKPRKGFLGFVWKIVLTGYYICFTIFLVRSSPPEDPINCSCGNTNCTITNAYATFPDRSICRAAEVFYPATEEQLVSVVANASSQKRKMRIATSTSHSIPKLACPDGEDGVLISTKYLNKMVKIDQSAMTVTVEPGMILKDLISESAMAGLAIPTVPYWWSLTVGGILGTGAHGSSLWGLGSAVHEHVIQLRIVTPAGPDEGYAKVRTLENGDPELNAAKVSFGVLGLISQVTLQLEPLFKRSISYEERSDLDLGDKATSFGKQHEFADFRWHPSQNKVFYRIDDRVPVETTGNAVYDFVGFRSTSSSELAVIRTTEETQEFMGNAVGKCTEGELTTSIDATLRFGLMGGGSILIDRYPAVGYNHRIQSSGSCLDSPEDGLLTACPWDPRIKGLYLFQTGISISLSKVKYFIQDVQKLVAMNPLALCGVDLYDGFLMRYVKASSAYLGKQDDALEFDITFYRSKNPMAPRLFEDVLEEIEQMALFKYNGLPHWGKNRNLAFVGAINKYKNASEFLKVKELYDPLGLFSNEWTDQILGLKDGITIMKPGCALEGLCVCSNDVHCAPEKGYFCRPGRVYEDARVCTHLLS